MDKVSKPHIFRERGIELLPSGFSLPMASSLHASAIVLFLNPLLNINGKLRPIRTVAVKCEMKLEIGAPVIMVEAPKMIKTAASMPCLRVNSGLVKAGDVGRIVSRKPKDVWAVRLGIGTYLIDGKYFPPLELDQ